MHKIQIYPSWSEGIFHDRPNRFTLILKYKKNLIKTYIQNTGRMEEFLTKGHPFYFVPHKTEKYNFKTIATKYQNSFVYLETSKINTLFEILLTNKKFSLLPKEYKREYSIKHSRFDFAFFKNKSLTTLIELKSCTLCHNGMALFPDAPTKRGQKHIRDLENLPKTNNTVIFLITNSSAKKFFPNFHTDSEYSHLFLQANHTKFLAYSLKFTNPVTFDLDSLKKIPIDKNIVKNNLQNKGSYLLLFQNPIKQSLTIGRLGNIIFKPGFYVYAGSALNSLSTRLSRHKKIRKKLNWHVDFLRPHFNLIKTFPIQRKDKIESALAKKLQKFCDKSVNNFGATDTNENSHLFFFKKNPLLNENFNTLILDYRTFTEG